jgi:hypothetical protein
MRVTIFLLSAVLLVASACTTEQNTEELDKLTAELAAEKATSMDLVQDSDSLITVINGLQDKIEALTDEETEPVFTPAENEIRQLIKNLHEGWELVFSMDDSEKVLSYFLDEYKTNEVTISVNNLPGVKDHNQDSFREHIRALSEVDGLSISFGQTDFESIEVQGDIFATTYKTTFRVFQDNEQIGSAEVYCLVAGQDNDGWKIGNYSWVTFRSMEK